ncbi:MAG: BTAD domain-containing putative transcriptional regulator [Roseiflexaceae bacterium]
MTFATSAARGLLAYLAFESDRPQSREQLAAMFWPDQPQAAAYANLRQTLARLRKAFPQNADIAGFLAITPQTIQFIHGAASLDVERFEQLVAACAAHGHVDLLGCSTCVGRLQEAAKLYRGELLQGIFLAHSQPFEEWLLLKREGLFRQALKVLHTLTLYYEAAGNYDQMRRYAAQQLALEPWREEAHVQVMRALVYSGQRTAALAQYDACRRILDAELGVEPSPELAALYAQIKAGLLRPPLPPAMARGPLAPPAPPTALVGRDEELAFITARLRDPSCRIVTLTGPGGVGKTHLSLQVAQILGEAFDDGVVFISLAAISDPELVLPTIARSLDVQQVAGHSLFNSMVATLRDQHLLLLLDNFEQVAPAAPRMSELLAHVPGLKLLITSRAALRLRAEQEIVVAPLALPTPPWTTSSIIRYPSIALFVQRAQAIMPRFVLADSNAGAVAEICTRLDGLPLAIELAAARVKLLPAQQLLQRLSRRLDLLTGGMQDLPTRQQTLRHTIDWSYNLLQTHEQQVFARLAIFVSGSALEAVEAICQLADDPPIGILDRLQSLVANSLLRQTVGEDGMPRFSMLETIREYGIERLHASGKADAIRERHAMYYLRLAEEAAPELAGGPAQAIWFARVASELDNIRAVLGWAMERCEAMVALRLGVALREFWMTRAYLREGREWLESALALDDHASGAGDDALRGKALTTAGWLAANQRDYAAAEVLFQHSLTLAYRTEEPQQIIAVLGDLGQAARMQGDFDRATALYKEALALSREIGDTRGVAWTLCNLGMIAHATRHDGEVAALLEDGVAVSQALGDWICKAWCLTFLARAAKDQGHYSQSAAIFAETLAIFRDVGHADGMAFTLEGRAGLAAAWGDIRSTARLFGAAEALREAINRPQPPYERDLETTLVDTDSVIWQAAWLEGRAIPTEHVIAGVLEELPGQAM